MDDLEPLRYPVGRLPRYPAPLDGRERDAFIHVIEQAPSRFRALTAGLTDAQLETPYRPGGWTIRQVVHHVPDSHLNAYVRMKLAVTEDAPAIKTYEEARWAELPDARSAPIAMSLALLEALHARWTAFLHTLPDADFRKPFTHPQWGRVSVEESTGMYAWHCRHHAAHIEQALGRRPALG
jgi:hypothetical protein